MLSSFQGGLKHKWYGGVKHLPVFYLISAEFYNQLLVTQELSEGLNT